MHQSHCFSLSLAGALALVMSHATAPVSAAPAEDLPDLRLQPWQCTGPFKEGLFENVMETFNKVYEPERQYLDAGTPNLNAVYEAKPVPGILDTRRPWAAHPEWVDGYRHLLPRGPAPSRSETVYLYRVLTSARAAEVEMHLNAEDYIRVWLNGAIVGEAHRHYGPSRFASAVRTTLPLRQGDNHLLVKISSLHAAHGFAFSLPAIHPSHPLKPGQWAPELHGQYPGGRQTGFTSIDQPYASAEPKLVAAASEATRRADALERLRRFRGELRMTPMFDPPRSLMYELLDEQAEPSPAGQAYHVRRQQLGKSVTAALSLAESGDSRAEKAVLETAHRIEEHWRAAIADLPPILFIQRPAYAVNAIAPYWNRGSLPASICVFDPQHPERPARVVFHDANMSIYDMNLSWDGKTIFFSAQAGKSGRWQLYEVGVDGRGLKRITHNDEADYVSPVELPSGDLMFVSTQANTWVQCQAKKAGLLYVARRDGSHMRKVSSNIDSDHTPQVMNDGRVLFTRWDYGVEKNVFARHALWTMNPDGTGLQLFFGNTIEDPAGFWKARPIPGRPEVVCVFGPHHSYQAGMLGLVWNERGPEAPRGEGFRFVTDEIPSYCDTNCGHGYQDPYPLNERVFLCSFGGDGGQKNRLYLVDDFGNRKCLYEAAGNLSCFDPMPLQARDRPPVLAPQCTDTEWHYRDPEEMNQHPDDLWATLLVQDVYRGLEPYVKRGAARYLQIMEQVPKSRCMVGGEAWGHTPIIGRGTVHVRRVIGTVPLEEDGSAYFQAPALRSLSLNLLDAEGRLLMRMGSDMNLMPGERRSCIGCHESRHESLAPPTAVRWPEAGTREPIRPTPPDWGTNGLVDYQKVVQPVFNRYCVTCHNGPCPPKGINWTGDRTRFFCMSYDNLIDRGLVDFTSVFALDHDENTPLTLGSLVSRIRERIETTHSGQVLPLEARRRLYTWIDANVPYYSTYDYTKVRGIGARDSWETGRGANEQGWMVGHVAPVFEKRCLNCHRRTVNNQALYGTNAAVVSSNLWTVRGVTAHVFPGRYPMSARYGPELRINLTHPSHSLMLQAPLARAAGGLGFCQDDDGRSIFTDTSDPDYQRMLMALEQGKARLYAEPRIDMDPEHVAKVRPTVLPEAEIAAVLDRFPAGLRGPMTLSGGLKALATLPTGMANVAGKASPDSPDGAPLQGSPPRVSLRGGSDGDPNTIWDDVDGKPLYRYRLTWEQPVSIAALALAGWAHHDFAPRDFDILVDGNKIGSVANAQYHANLLVLSLPATKCSSLELKITGCYGGSPCLRDLSVFSPP